MKFPFSLKAVSRAALAALALTVTVSCLPNSGPFAGGGPFNSQPAYTGSGGERTQVPTTSRSRRPALAATSVFFGGGGGGYYNRGYGSGYHSPGYCSSCGYNPCRCSSRSHGGSSHRGHGHHDDHSSHSSNRSSSSSSSSKHKNAHDTYRVASSSGLRSSQSKPSGYHSLDWYKSRGYDTSKLKLVNEHNQPKGHSSKSSSGSSKSKSSSSGSSGSSKSKSSSSKSSSSSGNTKGSRDKRRK